MGSERDTTGIDFLGSMANIGGTAMTIYEIEQATKIAGSYIPIVGPVIMAAGLLSTFGAASVKSMSGGAGEAYGEAVGQRADQLRCGNAATLLAGSGKEKLT